MYFKFGIIHAKKKCVIKGMVFSQNFCGGGGLAFRDNFWSPSGTESDRGTGIRGWTHVGDGVRWGDLEKLSAEAKNTPFSSKMKANFGVLSIKLSFLVQF